MAKYDPIRDSFREWNRLLIDSAQWDELHAQREADKQYKHSRLISQLQQQEFDNRMSEKRYNLALMGEERIANNMAFTQDMQRKQYDLDVKAAGRSKRQLELAEAKAQRERQKFEVEMEHATRLTTPRDLDLNGIIPGDLRENGAFMTDLNEFAGEMGAFVDSDLVVKTLNEDGSSSAVQMKPIDQGELAPALMGLVAKHNDPVANAKSNIEKLNLQRSDLKKIINKDSAILKDKAQAKRMIKKIDAQLREQYSTFLPENVKQSYGQRALELTQSAIWMRQRGMGDAAVNLEKMAQDFAERSIAAGGQRDGKGNNMVQLYNRELKKGKAVGAGKASYNTIDNTYTYPDSKGELVTSTTLPNNLTTVKPSEPTAESGGSVQRRLDAAFEFGHKALEKAFAPSNNIVPVTGDVQAGMIFSQGLYADIANRPIKNKKGKILRESGAPRTVAEAGALRKKVMQIHKEKHNEWYAEYKALKNSKDAEGMVDWEQLAIQVFGYLPTKPFEKQIYRAKSNTRLR
jgi:hypothetical protein